ncbi:MAG: sulfatase-like hydrolase/transferase [Myxococcales bacterium]|nr:sulfatase-like hydrolase/transferase [Myxococcales bacterium]
MLAFSTVRIPVMYGLVLGTLAGWLNALQDGLAMGFWLYAWQDRLGFLWRVVALNGGMGALLGLALGVFGSVLLRTGRWLVWRLLPQRAAWCERWLWSAPLLLLVAPWASITGYLLFTGGKMSKIPQRELWMGLSALILTALAQAAIVVGRQLADWAHRGPRARAMWTALFVIGVQTAVCKSNQYVLPNLYGYLHHSLSGVAFLLGGLAAWCALFHPRARLPTRCLSKCHLAMWGALPVALLLGFMVSLPHNENARAALLDPRAASSRTLMKLIGPALSDRRMNNEYAYAARRAQAARGRLTSHQGQGLGLTVVPAAHILLITVDALRPDHLGTYGYSRPTSPYIDDLAKSSWVFERAYTQTPHSSFAIASLMTSEYLYLVADLGRPLPEATLASRLAQAGYRTAAFYTLGIFHTQGQRLALYQDNAFGFKLHDHEVREAEALSTRVMEEIDRVVEAGEPPSLLWAHYFDVHEPYQATTFGTADSARYDSEILEVDTAVKRLIDHATKRFSRQVIVVLTADHGEEFRDHGGVYHGSTLYDEQVRVPLIVHVPGAAPRRIGVPVELIDLSPTLINLVGFSIPSTMRGMDMRPLAEGRERAVHPVFSAVSYQHMVVRWPYKLIADLRYNAHELYNLVHDPRERRNLADTERARVVDLRGEIHAWLDAVTKPPGEHASTDPYELALARGRLGNRESLPVLIEILQRKSLPKERRRDAAQLLGTLADNRAVPSLRKAMADHDPSVAQEAAIALGRLYQPQARGALLRLLSREEDPDVRARAAIALGRLRERAAVPALIEGLDSTSRDSERIETIRWLGRLRDRQAVEPLIDLLPNVQLRSFVAIALGYLGDRRALEPLLERLANEHSASIRDNIVRALGLLHAPEALAPLLKAAQKEPSLANATESLVRLGALSRGLIGGADMDKPAWSDPPFARCHTMPFYDDWQFSQRTSCDTAKPNFSLSLPLSNALFQASKSITLVLRARRLDASSPCTLTLRIGSYLLKPASVDHAWKEVRWTVPIEKLRPGNNALAVRVTPEDARLGIDHALFLPH